MKSFKGNLTVDSGLYPALAVLSAGRSDFMDLGSHPIWGLAALYVGLILIIIIPVTALIGIRIFRNAKAKRIKSYIEEMSIQAAKNEQAGQFVSAAFIYEKLKDFEKAAALYEKGGDFSRAAAVYESIGQFSKSTEMSQKAGDPEKAAETCLSVGDYLGAARIYDQIGDKLNAAKALEKAGNRLAAVRAYREAKDYVKASILLKEEGMLKEAADMFKLSLTEKMHESNLEKYYSYGALLEEAGAKEQAFGIYREISRIDPGYKDIGEKMAEATPGTEAAGRQTPETGPAGENRLQTTEKGLKSLRSMIRSGRMEPKYCLRIWIQILKALKQRELRNYFPASISPESILLDSNNNVIFEKPGPDLAYMAPEIKEGGNPDAVSEIYSAGIILYEMLAGGLDSLGKNRIGEVAHDVPPWLDELTMRCVDNDRSLRYRDIDEIFAALKQIKK